MQLSLEHPWLLSGLAIVVAVAVYALRRRALPTRRVSTLQFWTLALRQIQAGRPTVRRNRPTLSWLLLTAGALCAAGALAGPILQTPAGRRVALLICPSAELAWGDGMDRLRLRAGEAMDDRSSLDRVAIILPRTDSPLQWQTPAQARAQLAHLTAIPAAAHDLTFPPAPAQTDEVRAVGAVEAYHADGAGKVWPVPASLPPVTFDALGAAPVDDKLQLCLALRRHEAAWPTLNLAVQGLDDDGKVLWSSDIALQTAAAQRQSIVLTLETASALALTLTTPADQMLDRSFLARRVARMAKVAFVGAASPLLRRYVQADSRLTLVDDARNADLVIACGAQPPDDKPALILMPPEPPPGYLAGKPLANIALAQADIQANHRLLEHVNLGTLAIHSASPWIRADASTNQTIVSLAGQALIVHQGGGDAQPVMPPRVFIAFSLDAFNGTFAPSDAMVIFLANVMRELASEITDETYQWTRPSDCRLPDGSAAIVAGAPQWQSAKGQLPAPGLYRDSHGDLHAVNVLGLSAKRPPSVEPSPVAKNLHMNRQPLWPPLLLAAMVLWLAGWATAIAQCQMRWIY